MRKILALSLVGLALLGLASSAPACGIGFGLGGCYNSFASFAPIYSYCPAPAVVLAPIYSPVVQTYAAPVVQQTYAAPAVTVAPTYTAPVVAATYSAPIVAVAPIYSMPIYSTFFATAAPYCYHGSCLNGVCHTGTGGVVGAAAFRHR